LSGTLTQVIRDGIVDIPVGLFTRDDGLDVHPRRRAEPALRTRARRRTK
jgi:hypothetical protein